MHIPEWTRLATAVESVTLDIGFWISENFKYQVPISKKRKHKQQFCTQSQPLYQPCLKLYKGHNGQPFILSQTLQNPNYSNWETNIEELIKYYADVIRLSQETQCKPWFYYFGISPIVYISDKHASNRYASNKFEIILDDQIYGRQIEEFLEQFSIPEQGLFLWGIEQSCFLDIYATPNQVFFRRSIVSDPKPVCVVCDRQKFTEQVPLVRQRTAQILQQMRAAIGEDYWTD